MPPYWLEFQAPRLASHGYVGCESLPVTNSCNPVSLGAMVREISAGGVVVHRVGGGWNVAVIEPQSESSPVRQRRKISQKPVLALPKGLVDPGEKPEEAALREVR